MNVQLLSDLHFEMHRDGGHSFVASLDSSGVDVLVLAGDICYAADAEEVFGWFAAKYKNIVYVAGNHEFYTTSVWLGLEQLGVAAKSTGVHWLDGNAATVLGQRFLGGTLWFDDDPRDLRYRSQLNDFRMIKGFQPWVYAENRRVAAFLHGHVQHSDVVVTHHLPSQRSVNKRYADSPLNAFFVYEMDDLIEKVQPRLWLHGHTHSPCDYCLGDTRVISNPFGYPHEGVKGPQEKFIVEV